MAIKYEKAVPDKTGRTKPKLVSAKPIVEILPDQAKAIRQARGRPKAAAPKVHVSLRLDPDILEHFKSTGRGWQVRINDALRKSVR